MRQIIYSLALSFICLASAQAQVDRSVQPKSGADPKINLGKPQSFQLKNGLTVMVVENHKLPTVTFTLTLDNPLTLEGDLKGVHTLASSMMGNGTSRMSKDDFNEQLDYYGASVYFGMGGVSASTLSRYFPYVLSLTAHGALDPLFTQEELDAERAKNLDAIKAEEKNAQSIAKRVSKTLLYGKNHPKGEYISEKSLNQVSVIDIKDYYVANFIPQNAYLIVVGDVKFEDVKELVTTNFGHWKKAASVPTSVYAEPQNLKQTEIDLINVPNAVQSEIYVGNITKLKISDPDYFPALLANQILGGGGEGRLFMNLRETHGWTYGSYSAIGADKNTSNFIATASVRNAVTDSAVVEMMNELDRIRTTLPTQTDLDLAKAKFTGRFVMGAEKPQSIASFALNQKTQNLPANFYENYLTNLNAVTLEQVQAAAKKHISHDGVRIIVVGKSDEVIAGLEKLKYPIKHFDIYGKPIEQKVQISVADVK